ncbi:zinc finger protein 84-like, partial [Centruroides sculpturatus]|uniref:zinc finger protein 84-like n=1 Tax=Centruroides sculpturatus TaxID=218467 RepID=UPI000C6CCCD2
NREHLQAKSSQSSSKEPNERKHQCDKCPKKFLYKSQLQRHVRSHTGERPFLCQICKKAFTQKAHLKGHMALMHLNEETVSLSQDKKHQCSECGKTFSKKCLLDIHIRIHTGEKTFLCEICGKTFSQYGTLFRHRKIHFREFECNYDGCDFSTDHYFKLLRHVNREHLQAKSSQSSSKEPNERKHQCDKCPKKFLYKSQLQRHVRSHTGERPFLCQICKKAFTQKAHLKGHMALMHLNEETVSLSQIVTI